jgi:hypothetical protein
MKYYLFIGYQLIEKNVDYPTVQVFSDNTLIDEFICDNEFTTTIESIYKERVDETGTHGNKTVDHTAKFTFTTPKNTKVYEIDSSIWNNDSVFKIKVSDNNSNHTNGFMNKRSMILISPIFLMPKSLYEDKDTMEKIFLQSGKLKGKIPGLKKISPSVSRVRWPGFCTYSESEGATEYADNLKYLFSGGDFERKFNIQQKHGIYFITQKGKHALGFFHIDDFTHAWYQWMHRYRFYFLGTSLCSDSKRSGDITVVKNEINTINEDK